MFEDDDEKEAEPVGPASPEEIEAWEKAVGGTMPASLRTLYGRRDGGNLPIVIAPMSPF